MRQDSNLDSPSWTTGSTIRSDVRQKEYVLEAMVSNAIRSMPFLWLEVGDPAGPSSERGDIERNAIGLLSNFKRPALDPPALGWLGRLCTSGRVRDSGLWNSNHVNESYDDTFLNRFDQLVAEGQDS